VKDGAGVRQLDHNQTLSRLEQKGEWIGVAALSGEKGYVRKDMVSDTWIKVYKRERKLFLMNGEVPTREYKAALCPSNPMDDKTKQC